MQSADDVVQDKLKTDQEEKTTEEDIQQEQDSAHARPRLSGTTIVFLCTLIIWLLAHFVVVLAVIPSGSMEPTIMTGDKVIGNRVNLDIARGDIIIFKDPDGSGRYLIKRVIGMPGDTVEIRQNEDGTGAVYINENRYYEPYLKEDMDFSGALKLSVPAGGYFVMGDNRNQSYDARFWTNKIVYRKNIVGEAKAEIWPLGRVGTIGGLH